MRLAELGAFASPSALDGEAGLVAALEKRANAVNVDLFNGSPEILSVYHMPVPACNFAKTPCQAALRLAREEDVAPDQAAIRVRVPRAARKRVVPGLRFYRPVRPHSPSENENSIQRRRGANAR